MVHPPLRVEIGDTLSGTIKLRRQTANHRLLWVSMTLRHERAMSGQGLVQVGPERTLNWRID